VVKQCNCNGLGVLGREARINQFSDELCLPLGDIDFAELVTVVEVAFSTAV
jgi:hypothetical protein